LAGRSKFTSKFEEEQGMLATYAFLAVSFQG